MKINPPSPPPVQPPPDLASASGAAQSAYAAARDVVLGICAGKTADRCRELALRLDERLRTALAAMPYLSLPDIEFTVGHGCTSQVKYLGEFHRNGHAAALYACDRVLFYLRCCLDEPEDGEELGELLERADWCAVRRHFRAHVHLPEPSKLVALMDQELCGAIARRTGAERFEKLLEEDQSAPEAAVPAPAVATRPDPLDGLTETEVRILKLLMDGKHRTAQKVAEEADCETNYARRLLSPKSSLRQRKLVQREKRGYRAV